MMSDTPGGKLLARIQRQIAAHERAWFMPHVEEPEESESSERTQLPAPKAVKSGPPIDEKTGKPLYFVG